MPRRSKQSLRETTGAIRYTREMKEKRNKNPTTLPQLLTAASYISLLGWVGGRRGARGKVAWTAIRLGWRVYFYLHFLSGYSTIIFARNHTCCQDVRRLRIDAYIMTKELLLIWGVTTLDCEENCHYIMYYTMPQTSELLVVLRNYEWRRHPFFPVLLDLWCFWTYHFWYFFLLLCKI